MPPDMALTNVIRYGSPEQVYERTVSRPKANEITQSVIGQLQNVTTRFERLYMERSGPARSSTGESFLPLSSSTLSAETEEDIRNALDRCSEALGVISRETQLTG
eukprot:15432091-Alexandrium_andersonii.AAC.1